MIVPVRCFTCGKPIGHLWEEFKKRRESGEDCGKILDNLGLKRYCCREVFLATVELLKDVDKFKP
jgi:DNA-directed RNA polymerase subunit N